MSAYAAPLSISSTRLTARGHYYAYGYRRMWKMLRRAGEQVPRCRVQRLMHLYVKEDGSDYTADFNDWEEAVLEEELEKDDVVGWLRNDPRKPWAFRRPR